MDTWLLYHLNQRKSMHETFKYILYFALALVSSLLSRQKYNKKIPITF